MVLATGVVLSVVFSAQVQAKDTDPVVDARITLELFEKKDPSIRRFIESSSGYAVLPNVGKAAVGVGGAHGKGVLFNKAGQPVSHVAMTQVSVGLALGGQSFSEVIFFENEKAFMDFQKGNFALSAAVSAVALSVGAAKNAKYKDGVAVFTATKSGLMFEASVGGQKFSIKPL